MLRCRDWFQLTLKEGFTVFRDQQFTCDETSEASKRIDDISRLRTMQWPEDASPMCHPIRPERVLVQDNFYTPTVYDKGAEVIRLYYTLLGPKLFRQATDLYFERHDGDAVTCDDFRKAMSDTVSVYGKNDFLTRLIDTQFEHWYSQDGTPVLKLESMVHAGTTLTLKFHQSCPPSQSQPSKLPFVIPIKFGVLDPKNGEDLPIVMSSNSKYGKAKLLHGDTYVMTETKETLILHDVPPGAVLSLLRGLSAPVKLKIPSSIQSSNHLAFLMAHDQDWFNRYDASQKFAKKIIVDQINHAENSNNVKKYLECFHTMLTDPNIDPALKASSLELPMFESLNEAFEIDANPDAICNAKKKLKILIANTFKDDFLSTYQHARKACGEAYKFKPEHVAQRRLANLCLEYMTSCDPMDLDMINVCTKQFYNSDNMTDQYSALSCLANIDNAVSFKAIRDFYDQWNENSLVLDRWFAAQSVSSLPNGVERVKKLMNHEKFSLSNPNKLRSVVSSFCVGNPEQFHNPDGSGYRFLGDVIRKVDRRNPQMGAAMTKIFLDWTKYDASRRNKIKNELELILNNEGASSNTIEVATTALKAEKVPARI
jgi:aminopeptidase N